MLELAVRIPTVPVFSPADFDRDGAVDAYDYGVFEACIFQTPERAALLT